MFKRNHNYILLPLILFTLFSTSLVRAETISQPRLESSAYDLINTVNALRAAYGLPAYSINSILMFTAQNQADFMASNGVVTHSGPGGSNLTQRLLAAGYPLDGDLSQGGFRSENIIALSESMSAQDVVDAWMGDAPHQNTMLSQNLTEIGAGVAVVNGRAYYVIDCARPTTSAELPASTQVFEGGATVPANEAVIYPMVLSTPNASGEVIHEVKPGQTLWQIAISYKVKIDDIKRLNNISGNDIYPGDKLLITKDVTPTPVSPIIVIEADITVTASPSPTLTPTVAPSPTQTSLPRTSQKSSSVLTVALTIIVIAILGGGVVTWAGFKRNISL